MVKYFLHVRQCPLYGLAVLTAVIGLGLVTISLDPAELDSALGMVLFVQMFLASSGFAATARRGHFDPFLVHGRSRSALLVTHWCASIAPGAIAWGIVAGCAYVLSCPFAWSAFAGGRLAALLIVSAVAWVAGFWLPRGAGGALWMGILIVLLVRHPDLVPGGAETMMTAAQKTGALLLCPFLLLGSHSQFGGHVVAASCAVAAALLLVTIRAGGDLDVFLVERS